MRVKEIMTAPVVTVPADADVTEIARVLAHHHISAVPVLDGPDAVVGIVSEYDLLAKKGATAASIMSSGVVSVTEDTDVDDVVHLLVERRIRRLPVLAGARLVGIVGRADLVAAMATEWACQICGEPVRCEHRPARCPRCHAERDQFVLQETPPGS